MIWEDVMLYPILAVFCLILRSHSSLQRKDSNLNEENQSQSQSQSHSESPNDLNNYLNLCSIEELSELLNDKIAITKALQLSALKGTKTKELVESILKFGTNGDNTHIEADIERDKETIYSKDNEIEKNIDYENKATEIPENLNMPTESDSKLKEQDTLSSSSEKESFPETNEWPIDSSYYSFPLFIPHRNLRPPPDAKIKVQFKGKKREVNITVSPLMTVLEGLKQAEIKFKRLFKNIAIESDLINYWWSPTLGCIIVDKVSSVENNKSMKWTISVIDSEGEIEFEDFCLPANGQVFIKPGSTIQLVYTSVRDVKHIY